MYTGFFIIKDPFISNADIAMVLIVKRVAIRAFEVIKKDIKHNVNETFLAKISAKGFIYIPPGTARKSQL